MKILVTGGGGFLGKHVVADLLKEDHQVVSYQRSTHPQLTKLGVDVRCGSLTEADHLEQALSGCEAVIHIAAKAGVWGPRDDYFTTNVDGTKVLLEAMRKMGIRKLVNCSSPSVVFNGGSFDGEDESLPYGGNWLFAYPESKAVAEQLALEWGREGHGKAIALRPHLIWGKGDPHLFPQVIRRSQAGRFRIIGDGTNRVDTTRVENAAKAHLLALKALDNPEAVNRPYFISQGEPVQLWDWINSLLERLDIPPLEKSISLSTAYRLGTVFEKLWKVTGRESVPPMTRFVAVEMARSHWFSIEAARKMLGFRPEDFPTDEGLDAYVAAWKAGETPTD